MISVVSITIREKKGAVWSEDVISFTTCLAINFNISFWILPEEYFSCFLWSHNVGLSSSFASSCRSWRKLGSLPSWPLYSNAFALLRISMQRQFSENSAYYQFYQFSSEITTPMSFIVVGTVNRREWHCYLFYLWKSMWESNAPMVIKYRSNLHQHRIQ